MKLYYVYGRAENGLVYFLGETQAVSEAQACNNMRYRLFGEAPYRDIPMLFFAEERKPPPSTPTQGEFVFN